MNWVEVVSCVLFFVFWRQGELEIYWNVTAPGTVSTEAASGAAAAAAAPSPVGPSRQSPP